MPNPYLSLPAVPVTASAVFFDRVLGVGRKWGLPALKLYRLPPYVVGVGWPVGAVLMRVEVVPTRFFVRARTTLFVVGQEGWIEVAAFPALPARKVGATLAPIVRELLEQADGLKNTAGPRADDERG